MKYLVENGADVNAKDDVDWTPLHDTMHDLRPNLGGKWGKIVSKLTNFDYKSWKSTSFAIRIRVKKFVLYYKIIGNLSFSEEVIFSVVPNH